VEIVFKDLQASFTLAAATTRLKSIRMASHFSLEQERPLHSAFGIPTMRKMTADFENEVRVNGSENERNLYYEIIQLLREDLRTSN
jgi:hypothetical protein